MRCQRIPSFRQFHWISARARVRVADSKLDMGRKDIHKPAACRRFSGTRDCRASQLRVLPLAGAATRLCAGSSDHATRGTHDSASEVSHKLSCIKPANLKVGEAQSEAASPKMPDISFRFNGWYGAVFAAGFLRGTWVLTNGLKLIKISRCRGFVPATPQRGVSPTRNT